MSRYFSVTSTYQHGPWPISLRSGPIHPIHLSTESEGWGAAVSPCPKGPAEDGIKEPTGISSRREPSVKTTSTCRLRGQYKTKDYVQFTHIYMHIVYPRHPKYLGVMAKEQKKVSSKDKRHRPLLPPRRLNSVAPAREFSSSRPIVEGICPLESLTGAKV